jgi:glycerophosphoryl diester phosphodiesterase
MRLSVAASLAVLAAALSMTAIGGRAAAESKPKPDRPLSGVMSCLRGSNAMLVVAHAGGARPGAPENSIAAMEQSLPYAGVMEIDISGSADGVLFLMHDGTLDRTTTGTGKTAETYWSDLQNLRLKDMSGAETAFPIPTLEDALKWSAGKAVLELDKKLGATWAEIIQVVRQQGAEDRVIAIVRSPVEVAEIRRLSERVGVQFDLKAEDDWRRLRDLDVKSNSLSGWTGISTPNPGLWKQAKKKVAISFGTAGEPGKRFDDSIAASGDMSQYQWFAENGVDFLLTDAPQAASTAKDAAKGRKSCLGR